MRKMAMVVTLALGAAAPAFAREAANVRLHSKAMRERVSQALAGAAAKLEQTACSGLLDDFADGSGHRLRENLEALDVTASEYVTRIFFYDGLDEGRCRVSGILAETEPGSHVVWICSRFFERAGHDPELAEATVIHEALHTLGLGENPPSSQEITARVLKACR